MGGAQGQPQILKLSSTECYDALASHSVGRMGVVVDRFPLIIPVNYALDGTSAVIRTEPGTVLSHADQSRVTLQIDEFDVVSRSGWSVLLRGEGSLFDPHEPGEARGAMTTSELPTWAPGERQLWIRIRAASISGRRIIPGSNLEWRLTSMAYL
jgi:nitroimidazol reductase NimA-like FMN-containing flavoprotein (pyridoxamine 5'-phosphate oxidase superfamily)